MKRLNNKELNKYIEELKTLKPDEEQLLAFTSEYTWGKDNE